MTDNQTPPDWVLIEAAKRCSNSNEAFAALCDMIAKYKQPPVSVPEGQTPLDDNLGHRLLDVFREGAEARDSGAASPYHGASLEHCLHAAGWVQRDLRLALDAARDKHKQPPVDRKLLCAREALRQGNEGAFRDGNGNWTPEQEMVRAIELWESGYGA